MKLAKEYLRKQISHKWLLNHDPNENNNNIFNLNSSLCDNRDCFKKDQ